MHSRRVEKKTGEKQNRRKRKKKRRKTSIGSTQKNIYSGRQDLLKFKKPQQSMEFIVPCILGVATIAILCVCLRRRRRRLADSGELDPEERRFKQRLEHATASAFEVVEGDEDLELTVQEIEAIQTLEKELKESRLKRSMTPK